MKTYTITWITKVNGRHFDHTMTIQAETAKEARAKFDDIDARKAAIMGPGYKLPHKFSIKVTLQKEKEEKTA